MRDQHYIQGKWVDCKSAIPIPEMKELQALEELSQRSGAILPPGFKDDQRKVKLDIPQPIP